jgi:hypothetical protein
MNMVIKGISFIKKSFDEDFTVSQWEMTLKNIGNL